MIKAVQRKSIDKNIIQALKKSTGYSQNILEILYLRGIDTIDQIEEFFSDDITKLTSPFVIKDMDRAVDFVKNAVINNKKILIYGDYDCDGITGIAVMKKYFDSIGYDVDCYLPDRELEGYGLSEVCINNFMDMYKPNVVITVDCGVSNHTEIEMLKQKNVEVLVTDHHELPEILPDCIVINPKTSDNKLRNLAGVGVASKLVEALTDRDFVTSLYDIVAIGTIADLVDLLGENRLIVKHGLKLINQHRNLGLTMLLRNSKKMNVTEQDIAFSIAPQINSIGRMANANQVVKLFSSTDTFFLNTLIAKLEQLNNERKFLCDEIYNQAIKMLQNYDFIHNKVIVLQNNSWKSGILGIVASRLVEEYNLPTILFGNGTDEIKGSARSVSGINLYKMLSEYKDNFISFGGHASAAGLKIKSNYLPVLIKDLSKYIIDNNLDKYLAKTIVYDIEIDKITGDLVKEIDCLAPFGMANPMPKFLYKNDLIFTPFSQKHLKSEGAGSEILAFNQSENIQNYNNRSLMLLKLGKNTFNGITKYQGIVQENYLLNVKPNEGFILDYYKNLLYKSVDNKVNYIDNYSEILDKTDNIFGTAFVMYSEKTFNSFCNVVLNLPKYKNKFFVADIKNRSSIPPFNRVVLAPNKNYDFSGYKTIVFVETPLNMVYHIDSDIKVIADNFAYKEEIGNLNIDRDRLLDIYINLKNAVQNKERGACIDDWYNVVKNTYGVDCSGLEFSLAFYIFYELGFIDIKQNFNLVINKGKQALENSKIFSAIMAVKK